MLRGKEKSNTKVRKNNITWGKNQKLLAKKERLRWCRGIKKIDKIVHSKSLAKNSTCKLRRIPKDITTDEKEAGRFWSRPWWHTWFWFEDCTPIHDRLFIEMNRCLEEIEWMTKRMTTLTQKEPPKEIATNNYRPITCLRMLEKILTE